MLAIIDGMKNDRQHEYEIRLVDKRTSRRRKNDAFGIRATILKHRSVLGHVNPRENFQIFEKTNIGITSSSCPALFFLDRDLHRRADMEQSVEKMTSGRNDMEVVLQRRFNVGRLCEFKLHFGNIDSIVLYAFTIEICPELDVFNKEVTSEDRDTY
jgi:hypothetical protein